MTESKHNNSAITHAEAYERLVLAVLSHMRRIRRISQSKMAETLRISQSAYSRLECGDSGLSVEELHMITVALDSTPLTVLLTVNQLTTMYKLSITELTAELLRNEDVRYLGTILSKAA